MSDNYIYSVVNTLIKELSECGQYSGAMIHTSIKRFYCSIVSCQYHPTVTQVKECLEKHGWDWIQLKLFKYPDIAQLVNELKIICPNNVKDNNTGMTNLNITITINNLIQNIREERQKAVALYNDAVVKNKLTTDPVIVEINECLRQYGLNWETMQFLGSPNKTLLIDDIEKIKDKYIVRNKPLLTNEEEKITKNNTYIIDIKPPETIKSIIMDLVQDIINEKENAISYYNASIEYYKLQNKLVVLEIRNILTKHGWYWWGMRFTTEPNRTLLTEDIQNILNKYDNDGDISNNLVSVSPNVQHSIPINNTYSQNNNTFPKNSNTLSKNNYNKYTDYDANYNEAIKNSLISNEPKILDATHPVTKVVGTLFKNLYEESLLSKFTNCIAKFCEAIDKNHYEHETIIVDIYNVLEKHLWNWDSKKGPRGFYTEPKREILISDIQDVKDNYIIINDDIMIEEQNIEDGDIMPKSSHKEKLNQEDFLTQTINNLITELYSSISLNAPVNTYYEAIKLSSKQKEYVVIEINKILLRYKWIPPMMKFHPDPDRESLIMDLQDVVERFT